MENKNNINLPEKQINVYENFNYVGVKETTAYLLNDWSNSFNINSFSERYIWDVVNIDFTVNAVMNIVATVWDVINDTFISVIVDSTRTRIGKFRPFLVGMQLPLTVMSIFTWLIPLFFPGTNGTYLPKLFYYYFFLIINALRHRGCRC